MRTFAKEYFYNNFFNYFKLLIITLIGIVIAIIMINNTSSNGKETIKRIADTKIESVRESNSVENKKIFSQSMINKLKEILLIVFLATSIIGIPFAYLIIAKKAFGIAYTISAIFATQSTKTALIFIFNGLIFHNIIYMISMFMVLVAGENFIKSFWQKQNDLKFEVIKYLIFVIISIMIVIISSLFEAYLSMFLLNAFKKYL